MTSRSFAHRAAVVIVAALTAGLAVDDAAAEPLELPQLGVEIDVAPGWTLGSDPSSTDDYVQFRSSIDEVSIKLEATAGGDCASWTDERVVMTCPEGFICMPWTGTGDAGKVEVLLFCADVPGGTMTGITARAVKDMEGALGAVNELLVRSLAAVRALRRSTPFVLQAEGANLDLSVPGEDSWKIIAGSPDLFEVSPGPTDLLGRERPKPLAVVGFAVRRDVRCADMFVTLDDAGYLATDASTWPVQVGRLVVNKRPDAKKHELVTCVAARDGALLITAQIERDDASDYLDGVRAVFAATGADTFPAADRSIVWRRPPRPTGYIDSGFLALGRLVTELIVLRTDDGTEVSTSVGGRVGIELALPLTSGTAVPLLGVGLMGGAFKGGHFTFDARATAGVGVHVGRIDLAALGTAGVNRLGPTDGYGGVDGYLGAEGLVRIPLGGAVVDAAVLWSPDQLRMWAALVSRRAILSLGVEWIRYQAGPLAGNELFGLYFGAGAP